MSVRVTVTGFVDATTGEAIEMLCEGNTIIEVLRNAAYEHPNIRHRLLNIDNDELNPYVGIYLNNTHIEILQGARTGVQSGDNILVAHLIGGG